MGHLRARKGPRKMTMATKPHGGRGKRNPPTVAEEMDRMAEDEALDMQELDDLMRHIFGDNNTCDFCDQPIEDHLTKCTACVYGIKNGPTETETD